MKLTASAILAGLILVASHPFGQADEEAWRKADAERRKKDEMYEVHWRSQMHHQERHEDMAIAFLSDSKRMEKAPKDTLAAFQFLERSRSVKAVPVLCDRLLYKHPGAAAKSDQDFHPAYPAMAALKAIGRPAAEGLLFKIATTDTTAPYREAATTVMVAAVGKGDVAGVIERFEKDALHREPFTKLPGYEQYRPDGPVRLLRFKTQIRTFLEGKG
jgi:hypothetical protein